MKHSIIVLLALLLISMGSSCTSRGNETLRTISINILPESHCAVILHGPDTNGRYYYSIANTAEGAVERYDTWPFGTGTIDPEEAPIIRQEGPGTYRVTLGKGPHAEFVVVDTLQKRIVKDSNPENAPNRPFKTEKQ
ncbi:MAG: hypothetical protein KDA74_18345 [Planctomycetaceae bacterium]|nr:hypothetical protein [Planctomycetaceae bacterium]